MKKTRSRNAKKARPHHITRREFVGGALAAGVVAGAPAILRGGISTTSSTSRSSPPAAGPRPASAS